MYQTVVETTEFIKKAKTCILEGQKDKFIAYIAEYPLKGDLIQGTGGSRKIRWFSSGDKGKRGGVRIIYYYHSSEMPIFLFTVYGKNQKANLSKTERSTLKIIIKQIVASYEVKK